MLKLLSCLLFMIALSGAVTAEEDNTSIEAETPLANLPVKKSPASKRNPASTLQSLNPTSQERKIPNPQPGKPLTRITRKGEYLYKTQFSEQKRAAAFRVGAFAAPGLENKYGITFDDIYGGGTIPIVMLDYEWQIFQSLGKLGIKAGSGIFVANGKGRFAKDLAEAREGFTFFAFPNSLGAVYRGQIWERQWLIPYAEGGLNYFTFAETRDDDKGPKFGGALASYFAGGMALSLGAFDRKSMIELDREFGINNVYLTVEYRKVIGMNSKFDFSSNLFNGGFLFEF